MIRDFALPDLGEGLTESEIVEWHVAVGDRIVLNQPIAEVETAKAIVQLPSPFAGIVTALHAEPGMTVLVGTPILSVEVVEEALAEVPAASVTVMDAAALEDPAGSVPEDVTVGAVTQEPAAALENVVGAVAAAHKGAAVPRAATAPERNAVLVGYGPAVETGARPKRRPRTNNQVTHPALGDPIRVMPMPSPPMRKLAHDLGVQLASLVGTGTGGSITRDDVLAASATVPGAHGETRTPIRGVRKHTAAAMVASAFAAPHITLFLTVDVTRTVELVARLRARGESASVLGVVGKALCLALRRNPSLNSHWDEAAGEIVEYSKVGLGIAVATPRGLLVPHIPDAASLALGPLTDAIAALAETARAGKTTPADLAGGTITITNVGVFGVDAGTPILNPGEAAILATGAVRRLPWEYEGEIALRQVMTLSLSCDHRLVDGEQGARFLADIGGVLSDPATVLALT